MGIALVKEETSIENKQANYSVRSVAVEGKTSAVLAKRRKIRIIPQKTYLLEETPLQEVHLLKVKHL